MPAQARRPSAWTGRQRFLRGEAKKLYVVIPYLKTSETVTLRGIEFYPLQAAKKSRSKDAKVIKTISSMFFLRDRYQIVDMAYAVIDVQATELDPSVIDQRLDEVEVVLAYLYTSPGRRLQEPFLTAEHASIFRFVPSLISGWKLAVTDHPAVQPLPRTPAPNPKSDYDGFEAWTSRREHLYLMPDSRIYPPRRDFWLNHSQDLGVDIQQIRWPFARGGIPVLLSAEEAIAPELEQRLLRAMRWYCRSATRATDDEQALLNLAIGFEALLQLSWTGKTVDLCQRIELLTGPVPRMDSWATQFYRARCEIAHEGAASSTEFLAVDACRIKEARAKRIPATRYRGLTDYGRLIFRQCLSAVLAGGTGAHRLRLHRLFFHNQERLEKLCTLLQQPPVRGTEDRELQDIAELVGGLNEAWWASEGSTDVRTVMSAGAMLATRYMKGVEPAEDDVVQTAIAKLTADDGTRTVEDCVRIWKNLASELGDRLKGSPGEVHSILISPTTWEQALAAFACFAGSASMALKAWAADKGLPSAF